MKLLCFFVGIFTALASFAEQATTRSIAPGGTTANTPSSTGMRTVNGTSTTGSAGTSSFRGITPSVSATTATTTDASAAGITTNQAGVGVVIQNETNLFGQITGTTTNFVPGAGLGTGNAATATTIGGGTTVAQQIAQGIGAPGFTQVTITLQGTVQSEVDRQSILNRFQGLPGFVVVDQLQVAGQSVNEAAGAATGTGIDTGTGVGISTSTGLTRP